MNLETNIRPISYIKTNAADVIRQINDTHNPIVITQNGEARGVLIDPKSYQEMIDALGILKLLAQSEKSIETGDVQSHQQVIAAARRRLKIT
jgi:prevent-host-death family protein